jgi:aspartyl-tRNA(Asn)/glutamyl-tRNA(Gln) amidotransferase subunit C
MGVSKADVRHVAALARLELDADEAGTVAGQLSTILEHVDVLRAVPVADVEPQPGAAGQAGALRPDRAAPEPLALPLSELAPAWHDGFFTVPRLSHAQPAADPAPDRPGA